jgi:hypothetical protein
LRCGKENLSKKMSCQRCGKLVLTRSEFTVKLNTMGLKLNSGGTSR